MQLVADELEAWSAVTALPSPGATPDLASVAAGFRSLLPVIRQEPIALQQRRETIESLADLAKPEVERAVNEVRRQCPDLEVGIGLGGWVAEQLATQQSAASRGVWLVATCDVPREVVNQPSRIQFVSGVGFNTYIDGTTTLGAMQYYLGDRALQETVLWTTGEELVDPTLPSCVLRMRALLQELWERLPAGLNSYLAVLSDFNRRPT